MKRKTIALSLSIIASLFLYVAHAQSQSLQGIIVSTGDSITRGWGLASPAEGYVSRLSVLTGINTVNLGVDGAESWYGSQMIGTWLNQYKPQNLTIYYGNNDAGHYYTEFVISNLRDMVDACLAYGTRPILATLGPQFGAYEWRQPYILDINQGIRQLAAEKGIPVADIAIALWGNPSYFLSDGIHPNSAGHAIIADTFFQAINQCAYGISPISESFQHSGGTGSVSVTAGTACSSWTAVSNADWITVTGGSSGVGSGTVSYQVAFNNTGSDRTGALTIAGKTFTVFQAMNQCAYAVSPISENFRHSGGTGSVSVTTDTACSWTAVSNADWITLTGGGSGVGSGTVSYQVAFNNTGRDRTGTLTIAGNTFTVIQKRAPALNFLILLLDK